MIGYCTNVHAGATLDEVLANLDEHAVGVRERLGRDSIGIGLWLAAPAARELVRGHAAVELRDWLAARGLIVFTMNGFPYGDFHEPVVKHRVYEPSWEDPARAAYTLDLARILDVIAPPELDVSISTVPLGWRGRVDPARCAAGLRSVANALAELEVDRGRHVHVDLEPEPGCALDRGTDVVEFFENQLLPGGDEAVLRRHIGVCHDICHAAVMFEEQAAVLAQYEAAAISVGKVQVSSAVRVPFESGDVQQMKTALEGFAEDRYLHQTVVHCGVDGNAFYEDLPLALEARGPEGEWRVHYHVPIFAERAGALRTTQPEIAACVRAARSLCDTWEIETYAWTVLPMELRATKLSEGIAREIEWFEGVVRGSHSTCAH